MFKKNGKANIAILALDLFLTVLPLKDVETLAVFAFKEDADLYSRHTLSSTIRGPFNSKSFVAVIDQQKLRCSV